MNVHRLTVSENHLVACVEHGMFATAKIPRTFDLGDLLLLQPLSLQNEEMPIRYAINYLGRVAGTHGASIIQRLWPDSDGTWTCLEFGISVSEFVPGFRLGRLLATDNYRARTTYYQLTPEHARLVLRVGRKLIRTFPRCSVVDVVQRYSTAF